MGNNFTSLDTIPRFRVTLSAREMAALQIALTVSREQFNQDAAVCKDVPSAQDKFLAQARDCGDMLEKLETVALMAALAAA